MLLSLQYSWAGTLKDRLFLQLDSGNHSALINELVFTTKGDYLLSASSDKQIRVWDVEKKRTERIIRGEVSNGQQGQIFAMALSPDQRWLAVGGQFPGNATQIKYAIRIYDYSTGKLKKLLKQHTDDVVSLEFSKNNKLLSSASKDKQAIIWDVDTFQIKQKLQGHSDKVYQARFTSDSQRLVTSSDDMLIKLWRVGDGSLIKTMKKHIHNVRAIAVSNKYIISASQDHNIYLWNAQTGDFIKHLFFSKKTAFGKMQITPDGHHVVVASSNRPNIVQVISIDQGKVINTYTGHDNLVLGLAISPDGRRAATGGGNQKHIDIWELKTGKVKNSFFNKGHTVFEVAFSSDGKTLAWGYQRPKKGEKGIHYDYQIKLPQNEYQQILPEKIKPHSLYKKSSVDYKNWTILRGDSDGKFKGRKSIRSPVLEITKQGVLSSEIHRVKDKGRYHLSYTYTADGQFVVSSGLGGYMYIYDLSGNEVGQFVGHVGDIWSVSASPNGKFLASGSADQTVRIWNIKNQKLLLTLFHTEDGEWVTWTPEGYYDGTYPGAKMVGWQINRGVTQSPDYVAAGQMRHDFHKPSIINRTLRLASSEKAVSVYLQAKKQQIQQEAKYQKELKEKQSSEYFVRKNKAKEVERRIKKAQEQQRIAKAKFEQQQKRIEIENKVSLVEKQEKEQKLRLELVQLEKQKIKNAADIKKNTAIKEAGGRIKELEELIRIEKEKHQQKNKLREENNKARIAKIKEREQELAIELAQYKQNNNKGENSWWEKLKTKAKQQVIVENPVVVPRSIQEKLTQQTAFNFNVAFKGAVDSKNRLQTFEQQEIIVLNVEGELSKPEKPEITVLVNGVNTSVDINPNPDRANSYLLSIVLLPLQQNTIEVKLKDNNVFIDEPKELIAIVQSRVAAKEQQLTSENLELNFDGSGSETFDNQVSLNLVFKSGEIPDIDEVNSEIKVYINNVQINGVIIEEPEGFDNNYLELINIPLETQQRNHIVVSYAGQKISVDIEHKKDLGKLYVLAVGVSDYSGLEGAQNLSSAVNDAEDIAKIFRKQNDTVANRIYNSVEIVYLINDKASKKNIKYEADKLFQKATIKDTVILFIAGHGILNDKTGDYYYVPYIRKGEISNEKYYKNHLKNKELVALFDGVQGQRIFWADTCHSAAAIDVSGGAEQTDNNIFWMSASAKDEKAFSNASNSNGFFTNAILETLEREGKNKPLNYLKFRNRVAEFYVDNKNAENSQKLGNNLDYVSEAIKSRIIVGY